jgi:hypothetical protein
MSDTTTTDNTTVAEVIATLIDNDNAGNPTYYYSVRPNPPHPAIVTEDSGGMVVYSELIVFSGNSPATSPGSWHRRLSCFS